MRIVCFHLNQVGDLVFSLPALKSIRDSFPDASITSVVRPALGELIESCGLVDDVLYRNKGINLGKAKLTTELAARRFDLAVALSQSASCAFLAYASRAPRRVGFKNTSMGWLLTERVNFKHPPSVENNLRLVESIGCQVIKRDYSGLLHPSETQTERAERILLGCGIETDDTVVAFAPGTSGRRSVKEWTDEGFAEVGRYLVNQGVRVVLLGTQPMPKIVEDCPQILDLSGRTNLGEAAAILHRCRALVAVDSGILHMGAAVGTKVIGLYGPSNSHVTGPQGEGHIVVTSDAGCIPCMQTSCNIQRECMIGIKPDMVTAAIDRIFSK